MTSNLSREWERAFFADLADLELLRSSKIEDEWDAINFIQEQNEVKQQQMYKLNEEILNNIFFLTDTNSRRAYLNRLLLIVEGTENGVGRNSTIFIEGSEAPVRIIRRQPAKAYELEHGRVYLYFAQALAHLAKLKTTLQFYIKAETGEMQQVSPAPAVTVNKIPWSGTPQEFGAICNKLIDQGYIPKVKNLKHTVQMLSHHFQVIDTDGKEATEGNLYKCFIERPKAYFPEEFKLIKSDNYGKVK